MSESEPYTLLKAWRAWLGEVIFETRTPAGKTFDICLLIAILLSVLAVTMESVESFREQNTALLIGAEVFFTILFTFEYAARIFCSRRPLRYIFSFWGLIDLLAILPGFLMILIPGAQRLSVIRSLRLLRAFRVFKLANMLSEAKLLRQAVWSSRSKIAVFVTFIVIVVVVVGSTMHVVEGPEHGFDSIPISMYWTVVTMTTVGYGDIRPETPFGMTLAAILMLLGYSVIIVPTGILTAELANPSHSAPSDSSSYADQSNKGQPDAVQPDAGPRAESEPPNLSIAKKDVGGQCASCNAAGHDPDARFCKHCGAALLR